MGRLSICTSVLVIAVAASASAEYPPLGQQVKHQKATLVVCGEVTRVSRQQQTHAVPPPLPDEEPGKTVVFDVQIRVQEIEKGVGPQAGDVLHAFGYRVVPPIPKPVRGPTGEWFSPPGRFSFGTAMFYIPARGERVRLYLGDQVSGQWEPAAEIFQIGSGYLLLVPNGIELFRPGEGWVDPGLNDPEMNAGMLSQVTPWSWLIVAVMLVGTGAIGYWRWKRRRPAG